MKDNSEKMYDGVTDIRDDLVENAKTQNIKPPKMKRPWWTAVIAAVLVAAIFAGEMLMPGGTGVNAYAISEATYPEMDQYPDEYLYMHADGSFDSEGFSAAFDPWFEDVQAQRRPDGYADGLEAYFKRSTEQFLSGAEGENVTYSPLNVYMALAMLAELTDGESRAQILSLLGAESIEELRQQANDVWNASYRDDGAVASILASSLWLNQDVEFNQETLDTLAENYYASSYSGEMGSDDFNAALQDWLDKQTGGLLSDEAGEVELEPETVLALATTVYFRSKWTSEFNEDNTKTDVFHTASGDVDAEFMHASRSASYYWQERFSASYMGLESGGRMWFILPDEGVSADELLASGEYMDLVLDPDGWTYQTYIIVNYAVPKFDTSSKFELSDGLKALGVTDVFDDAVSDFSPMTDMDGIYLSQAEHAVRVAIDEEGVTAAAYTVMANAGSGAPPEEEVDFTLDRPFIFVVTNPNNVPMFIGIVNNPA